MFEELRQCHLMMIFWDYTSNQRQQIRVRKFIEHEKSCYFYPKIEGNRKLRYGIGEQEFYSPFIWLEYGKQYPVLNVKDNKYLYVEVQGFKGYIEMEHCRSPKAQAHIKSMKVALKLFLPLNWK